MTFHHITQNFLKAEKYYTDILFRKQPSNTTYNLINKFIMHVSATRPFSGVSSKLLKRIKVYSYITDLIKGLKPELYISVKTLKYNIVICDLIAE
jgi:hypothetical protein